MVTTRKTLYRLRHIILFGVLIGSDFFIGHLGYTAGESGAGYGAMIATTIIVIIIVEFLFRGEK